MSDNSSRSKPAASKPALPKKPSEPVVRRIVNEKVINRDIALGRR